MIMDPYIRLQSASALSGCAAESHTGCFLSSKTCVAAIKFHSTRSHNVRSQRMLAHVGRKHQSRSRGARDNRFSAVWTYGPRNVLRLVFPTTRNSRCSSSCPTTRETPFLGPVTACLSIEPDIYGGMFDQTFHAVTPFTYVLFSRAGLRRVAADAPELIDGVAPPPPSPAASRRASGSTRPSTGASVGSSVQGSSAGTSRRCVWTRADLVWVLHFRFWLLTNGVVTQSDRFTNTTLADGITGSKRRQPVGQSRSRTASMT